MDGMFSIPSINLKKLEKRIETLNKKAERIGVQFANLVAGKPYTVEMLVNVDGRKGLVEFMLRAQSARSIL